ncbi:hypothetical protein JRG50_11900, partial [Micrococcus luteus]|nr:hypothetical protein [Micrococcus luteus]
MSPSHRLRDDPPAFAPDPAPAAVPDVPAAPGTVVEDVASGFTGAVIG